MISARSNWSGVVAMVLATGLFIVSDSLTKLAAQDMPFFQALLMRGAFGPLPARPRLIEALA